jgi:hypothetical protein
LGSLKIGDRIIVTEVLTSHPEASFIIGEIIEISYIDTVLDTFPFAISYNGRKYWVDGVPYSPLMMELM